MLFGILLTQQENNFGAYYPNPMNFLRYIQNIQVKETHSKYGTLNCGIEIMHHRDYIGKSSINRWNYVILVAQREQDGFFSRSIARQVHNHKACFDEMFRDQASCLTLLLHYRWCIVACKHTLLYCWFAFDTWKSRCRTIPKLQYTVIKAYLWNVQLSRMTSRQRGIIIIN